MSDNRSLGLSQIILEYWTVDTKKTGEAEFSFTVETERWQNVKLLRRKLALPWEQLTLMYSWRKRDLTSQDYSWLGILQRSLMLLPLLPEGINKSWTCVDPRALLCDHRIHLAIDFLEDRESSRMTCDPWVKRTRSSSEWATATFPAVAQCKWTRNKKMTEQIRKLSNVKWPRFTAKLIDLSWCRRCQEDGLGALVL